ncbi:lysylphosphatidylglycerol synthase domain-containing protein [Labedaea rhizosphaerae]|uniref:Lysylphosphatidylglycerol synthase-like protein n=1 Tax=Labedaea rhizosphaerae TaxID=598644 RepID=A0A4V3CYE8_LABRH|nr:lysylphosphatidylglycerol synthase domain-containing protein [Labedaea rhizosphaerae]TDP93878.1 hypothetical protein EV186_106272 [Labedaea rhizosphaerae]
MTPARRSSASRVVSVVLTLGAIAAIGWWIGQHRDAVWHAIDSISPLVMLGAAALVVAGSMLTMLSWRELTVPRDGVLGLRAASAFFFSTQLGKYLPGGGVWPVVAQSYLADTLGRSRSQMITAASVNLGISMLSRVVLAAGIVPVVVPGLWWVPLVGVAGFLLLVCLPGQVIALVSRLPKLRTVDASTAKALGGQIRRSACWSLAGWAVIGLHVYVLMVAAGADPLRVLYPAVAAQALATVLSSLAVFFPAGIGARELIMVGMLSQLVDPPSALAVTVVSRLVTAVVEIGLAVGLRRPRPHEVPTHQEKGVDSVRTPV